MMSKIGRKFTRGASLAEIEKSTTGQQLPVVTKPAVTGPKIAQQTVVTASHIHDAETRPSHSQSHGQPSSHPKSSADRIVDSIKRNRDKAMDRLRKTNARIRKTHLGDLEVGRWCEMFGRLYKRVRRNFPVCEHETDFGVYVLDEQDNLTKVPANTLVKVEAERLRQAA
jgi:hypothetical protein